MNKLLTASVALLALGLSVPAKAADMPVRYVAPPVFTWSGVYIGGNIGTKWMENGDGVATPSNAGTAAFFGACFAAGACPRNYGSDSALGVLGGFQVGFNAQTANWVWGAEIDFQASNATANSNILQSNLGTGFVPFTGNYNAEQRWLGTARLRLGYAVDKWLWYVTGGYAASVVNHRWDAGFPSLNQVTFGGTNKTHSGWTAGVGTEYALVGGWSVAAEYLYVALRGDTTIDAVGTTLNGCLVAGVDRCAFTLNTGEIHDHIYRFKINYRFDWASWGKGKAPAVVTK
jgi:outer membrane immunogenic protein